MRRSTGGLPADRVFSRGNPGHYENWPLLEDHALTLALVFRALAPMRSRDNLRAVVEGIEQMAGRKRPTGSE